MSERVRDQGVTRRDFVQVAAAAGAAASFPRTASAASHRRRFSGRTVAVLGGGVAGLTAAHELAERGFRVTVYERRALGGKARSVNVPHSAKGGRRPLPGEHGFRFFPGFYQNLPDTMARIPYGSNPRGAFDNLVQVPEIKFARAGGREDAVLPVALNSAPPTLDALRRALLGALDSATGVPPHEAAYFVERLLVYFTSCDERRLGEWEPESWWRFTAAEKFSEDYRRLLVSGVTRQILAAKGTMASTRTLGTLWEAFAYNLLGREGTGSFDRLLAGPTNEALIAPWVRHLRGLGVRFALHQEAQGLEFRAGRIVGAHMRGPRGRHAVRADWFVCAVPAERARRLWGHALRAHDPRLARVERLTTSWMNGIQFYLRRATPIAHGHVLYIDSPWALSSVSQAQFWRGEFAHRYGDGRARECLSVDIGDFNERGLLFRRPARELQPREIARDVWAQMKAHLNDSGERPLTDDLVLKWFIDPGLVYHRSRRGHRSRSVSQDALLINTPGSWANRPPAATSVPNLLLASDYVRTDVDVACMEGANEAGRQAVNALLERSRSRAERCTVHTLLKPPELEPLRRADAVSYRLGQPNALDTAPPL